MKALIVGGTGPTGPLVLEGLLKRNYEVAILHRGVHEIDLPAAVEHIHADPHFAETLEKGLGKRNFDLCIGMYGRLRFVAEVMKGRCGRFIAVAGQPYLSLVHGLKAAGGSPVPVAEDAPLCLEESINRPAYLMAISEQVVMEAHKQGHYAGTVFRYPMVYGPRQLAPREWSLVRRHLDGRKRLVIPNEGLSLLSRGYCDNMAHAVLLAVDQPEKSSGEIFNAADDRVLSLREWAAITGEVLNYQWEFVSLPSELARASRPYAGRDLHQVLDITRIKTVLGYRDIVPVEEGLRRSVLHYLQNQPERGGEVEKQLGDAFNYAVEDKLIEEFRSSIGNLRPMADVGYQWRHPYPHPKKPSG